MKKVGIVTFHFADNFGAVLQCYALQKVINSFDDVSAEIIDYRPSNFQYGRIWTSEKEKVMFWKKRKKFERFLLQYCNLSSSRERFVSGKGYDYCCVGSDQVWNFMDPAFSYKEYFLPNVMQNVHKIAYAASIGCSISELGRAQNFFQEYLPLFEKISVREKEHKEYISIVSNKKCYCVLDPTLLLDVKDYLPIVQKKEPIEFPYVLFYWLPHDKELFRGVELVNTIARKYNLKIVHSVIGAKEAMFVQEGKCMYYEGIEDFLWYIKNAAFVVTNSYHGTIFSLQFEVPFYTFIVESMKSRVNTLLDYADIGGRIPKKVTSYDDINKDIDYKEIKKSIFKHRIESIDYLKESIGII